MPMEQVIELLKPASYELHRVERDELGATVMEWEEEEKRRQARPAEAPQQTPPSQPLKRLSPQAPAVQRAVVGQQANVQAVSSPRLFGTRFLDPSKVAHISPEPASAQTHHMCLKCGKRNAAASSHCFFCSAPLRSTTINTATLDGPISSTTAVLGDVPVIFC
jgi:hypothetical protein